MTNYSAMKCEACRAGAPTAASGEINAFLQQHPDWEQIEVDGIAQIQRVFKFKDFLAALDFTNRIGQLAEEEGHHPALLTEWGRVTVRWWTHKIGGLHQNDLIMGAKTDDAFTKS